MPPFRASVLIVTDDDVAPRPAYVSPRELFYLDTYAERSVAPDGTAIYRLPASVGAAIMAPAPAARAPDDHRSCTGVPSDSAPGALTTTRSPARRPVSTAT